ncbi:unnamed protein product [Larinioides sclopetarius]|uniref:Uncharacterized protein n=1 Tax=Larinioides sclopetarius TaxID=280406 RepID=A0AAV1ZME9_9ARAC
MNGCEVCACLAPKPRKRFSPIEWILLSSIERILTPFLIVKFGLTAENAWSCGDGLFRNVRSYEGALFRA